MKLCSPACLRTQSVQLSAPSVHQTHVVLLTHSETTINPYPANVENRVSS